MSPFIMHISLLSHESYVPRLCAVVPHTTLANNYLGTKDKIPICFERSFFILQATTMLHILLTYWRPFGKTIYDVRDTPFLGSAIKAFSAFGFVFLMTSCFALDYFHLFGLSQGFGVDINKMVGLAPPTTSEGGLSTRWHYSIVAHPIMCGLLMEFWACARMTSSRLLLNVMGTMYCIGGVILFEEKKLEKELGKEYTEYLQTVPRFCPFMPPAIGKFPKSKAA